MAERGAMAFPRQDAYRKKPTGTQRMVIALHIFRKKGSNMSKFNHNEIEKLLDTLIGNTEPVADSAIDEQINENLMLLIDTVNWCLDGVYDAARHRKSLYGSQRVIGERAYAAMLEWKEWLGNVEDELA